MKQNLSWKKDKTATVMLDTEKQLSREFKKGFIRGLIDTDGHKETKFRRYIYGTISPKLRDNFSEILTELGIEHTNYCEKARKQNWRDMYKLRISGDSAREFNNRIKPRHPKKQYNDLGN